MVSLISESESEVAQLRPTLSDPMDQAPPSMGFSRQEHWSGLPLPSPSRNPTHYILTVYNNDGAKSLLILKYRTPPPQNHFIILESKYPRGYNNAFKMAGIKFPTYPDML